jgi:hypothetical protein
MSRMSKGRAEQVETLNTPESELGSRRRLRAAPLRPEQFERAFADALRDILHDELRPTG